MVSTNEIYMVNVVWLVFFSIFEAIWRRWFGGGAPSWFQKWPSWLRRLLLNGVNICAMFALFFYYRDLNWMWSLYAALASQLVYWNYTFGMYMDMGRCLPEPGDMRDKMVADYLEDPVNRYILNWIFDEPRRYGQYYDAFGMTFRYMWPMLLLLFVPTFSIGLLVLGPLVAFCYELWFVLREKNIGQSIFFIRDINEYGAGFVTGLFLAFSGV